MADRLPLTLVEIDVEACSHSYGTGGCPAVLGGTGAHKCFGSYKTCQARAAFAKTTKTLRFAQNVSGLPEEVHLYPCLKSVSTRAAEINLSGIDPNSSALGVRAKVTIRLEDFQDSDLSIDPYAAERRTGAAQADGLGYEPRDRSTFLRKLLARWPYLNGRACRVLTGYADQSLAQMTKRHYVISEWSGPDAAGALSLTAKDVFDLTDTDKAVLPSLSRGKLKADITATSGSFVLEPASVGEEYPGAGRICIGDEVMGFTRSGDSFTLTGRGWDGSAAKEHRAGDLVQLCVRFEAEDIPDALARVLTEGSTGAVPGSWIHLAAWREAAAGWLAGLRVTATLTKPYARKKLVGELCQLGVLLWPDEVAGQIRFRPNRPLAPGETAYPLSDDGSFIESSGSISEGADERISRVFLWHGMMSPTGSIDGADNMRRGAIGWNLDQEGALQYGETRIEQIGTRWLGEAGNDAVASTLAERLATRYADTPRTFAGAIDHRDGQNLKLGDICLVTSRLIISDLGLPEPTLMQVRSLEETVPGHRWSLKLQTFTFDGRFGFWRAAGAADYDNAAPVERDEGAYWIDQNTPDFDPYVWF